MIHTLVQLIIRVMRALAQYIMRGRWTAATVAIVGNWFLFMTPATISLVTLRRGAQEGFLILLWGVLPALVGVWASDLDALMAYTTVAAVAAAWLAAICLRVTTSWAPTLSAIVATASLAALLLVWLTDDVGASLQDGLGGDAPTEQLLTETPAPNGSPAESRESTASDPDEVVAASSISATGFLAFLVSLSAVMALLVGRWWQALLFNPGGLQQELHLLRLPPAIALTSFAASAWCLGQGEVYRLWCYVFGLPLLVAGLGLTHCLARARQWQTWVLWLLYGVLVLVRPAMLLIGLLAFADTFLNLRYRLKLTQ